MRGDIATPPQSSATSSSTGSTTASRYVKRVVGLPGDTVEVRGRLLVRNGSLVDEPYLRASEPGFRMPDLRPLTLGADEFFVLGDHRDNSMDSRLTGPVGRDQIVGRVEFIAFSYCGRERALGAVPGAARRRLTVLEC